MNSDKFRSIVLLVVATSIFAAMVPACSMEAEHIRVKVDRVHSMNDACQAKETLNEK